MLCLLLLAKKNLLKNKNSESWDTDKNKVTPTTKTNVIKNIQRSLNAKKEQRNVLTMY